MTTLYKNDRYWTILIESSKITKKWGKINGKESSTIQIIDYGKNIGKSNQTTPEQQANIIVNSCVKKYKDAGYYENLDENNRTVLPLPMLATNWNDETNLDYVYIQPKLDGVRLLVGRYNDELIMYSRTGKLMQFDNIKKICEFLKEGQFLDGEVYQSNMSFEDITGVFRGPSKNHSKIEYHCFDFFDVSKPQQPFKERLETLESFRLHEDLIIVVTSYIHTSDLAKQHKFISEQYEGTMIRDPNGLYHFDKRSKNLMKLKDFCTKEYIISGWETAKDNTVIWKCETDTGKIFKVRPKGTTEYRRKLLYDVNHIIGKFLTVKFQETTNKHQVPRFPVGLAIRDYE